MSRRLRRRTLSIMVGAHFATVAHGRNATRFQHAVTRVPAGHAPAGAGTSPRRSRSRTPYAVMAVFAHRISSAHPARLQARPLPAGPAAGDTSRSADRPAGKTSQLRGMDRRTVTDAHSGANRMRQELRSLTLPLLGLLLVAGCSEPTAPAGTARGGTDPLPSWNDGAGQGARSSTSSPRVTQEGGPDFVPPPERIATFDNDGTLWSEKPVPFQVLFALRSREGAGAAAPRVGDASSRSRRSSRATWPALRRPARRASSRSSPRRTRA